MTLVEILAATGIFAVIAYGGWRQYPIFDESDPAFQEAMLYSEKSSTHKEATAFLWRCSDRRGNWPEQCAEIAIGKATSEGGGPHGTQVKEALEDTRAHMQEWLKNHPIDGGVFTKVSHKAERIYR